MREAAAKAELAESQQQAAVIAISELSAASEAAFEAAQCGRNPLVKVPPPSSVLVTCLICACTAMRPTLRPEPTLCSWRVL